MNNVFPARFFLQEWDNSSSSLSAITDRPCHQTSELQIFHHKEKYWKSFYLRQVFQNFTILALCAHTVPSL